MSTYRHCARTTALAFALSASASLSTTPQAFAQGSGGGGPSSSPAIVYAEQGKHAKSLKVVNADGSTPTTVLANVGTSLPDASWSADGFEILFTSNLLGTWGICSVRPDGSNLRLILPVTWDLSKPAWSPVPAPDGQFKILFEDRPPGQSNTDLFLVNLDGTGLVNLTDSPAVAESKPTWAPDAARCAARVGHGSPWRTDIVVYDLGAAAGSVVVTSTSNVTDLPGSPLQNASTLASPDWARTSDRIALCALGSSGTFDLWVIHLTAPEAPVRLTATSTVSEQDPSWSPDDTRIVFRRNAGNTTSGLYRIDANGSGLISLNAKSGYMPDWRRP